MMNRIVESDGPPIPSPAALSLRNNARSPEDPLLSGGARAALTGPLGAALAAWSAELGVACSVCRHEGPHRYDGVGRSGGAMIRCAGCARRGVA